MSRAGGEERDPCILGVEKRVQCISRIQQPLQVFLGKRPTPLPCPHSPLPQEATNTRCPPPPAPPPPQEATDLAQRCLNRALEKGASRRAAARIAASVLTKAALDKGTKDNTTVLVVDLKAEDRAPATPAAVPTARPVAPASTAASGLDASVPAITAIAENTAAEGPSVLAPVAPTPAVAVAPAVGAAPAATEPFCPGPSDGGPEADIRQLPPCTVG